MEKLKELINKFKHNFFGCESFWVVQLNKNKKPFKRMCSFCGAQGMRVNGKWRGGLAPKLNKKNCRW